MCDSGGYGTPIGGGTHGGMHATELAAVLIGDGTGLRSGGEIVASRTGIFDIAPTVLHLLGLEQPDDHDRPGDARAVRRWRSRAGSRG